MNKHHALLGSLLVFAAAPSFAVATTSSFPAGRFTGGKTTMVFDGAGNFRLLQGAKSMVDGKFAVNGDQVRFNDASGSWACPKDQTGIYHWTYADATLAFHKIDDGCAGRSHDLPAQSWKRGQ